MPQIKLETLEGKTSSLDQLSNPSLILFYLPQSSSCQQQLEILNEIKTTTPQLKVIAIAIGDLSQKKLLQLRKKYDLQFTLLIDKKAELTEQLKISTIPTLVFYHPSKKLKFKEGLCKLKELNKIIAQTLQAK